MYEIGVEKHWDGEDQRNPERALKHCFAMSGMLAMLLMSHLFVLCVPRMLRHNKKPSKRATSGPVIIFTRHKFKLYEYNKFYTTGLSK